jgi:hypothetical protein
MLEERRVLSTLTVTSNSDNPWAGTLRNEIAAAQPGDTIDFASGLQTITLVSGQLEINKNLTIQGPGSSLLAIDGGGVYGSRVFQVDAGTKVTISGLTIEDGSGDRYNNQGYGSVFSTGPATDSYDGYGGGVLNLGTLALSGCNVTNNSVGFLLGFAFGTNFEGGGIYNHGTMTLSGCNVTGNSADAVVADAGPPEYVRPAAGGGIFNDGTMSLSGCAVTGNTAGFVNGQDGKGGGIFNDTQGHLTIRSGVVKNNTASDGPDICNLGSMTISKDSSIGSKVSRR